MNNNQPQQQPPPTMTIQLCASCDRCRSRKTKCDGSRPCLNCKNRYLRVHKLTAEDLSKTIDSMDSTEFDCIYSPAKRRGPVPGKSNSSSNAAANNNNSGLARSSQQQQQMPQLQLQGGGQYSNNSQNVDYTTNSNNNSSTNNGNTTSGDVLVHSGFDSMSLQSAAGGGFSTGRQQQQQQTSSTLNSNLGNTVNNNNNNSCSAGGGGVDLNALLGQLNVPQLHSNGSSTTNLNNNSSSIGGGNIGGTNNIVATDQMKQMLLLQQQLMLQQQQIQQQQLAQQLVNTTATAAAAAVSSVGGGGGGGGLNALIGSGGSGRGGGVVNNSSLQLLQQYQNSQQQPHQQQHQQHHQQTMQTPLQQLQQVNLNQIQHHQQQQQHQQQQHQQQQHQQQQHQHQQMNNNQMNPMAVLSGQHQMQQHQQQQQSSSRGSFYDESPTNSYHQHQHHQQRQDGNMSRSNKRTATTPTLSSSSTNNNNTPTSTIVSTHLPLLNPHNPSGKLLRQYFELSTNNVLNLPPIPTNEAYCAMITTTAQQQQQQQQQGLGNMYNTTANNTNLTPENLPWYDQSALNAARFSELALGALSNDQVGLALELSNACVMCLKNCVEEQSHKSCLSAVARAYFLHGVLRSLRGDFVRYFKYRRVCMTQISMLDDGGEQQEDTTVDALLAAISFHDAWAYMMYNAVEDELPDIDNVLPRVPCNHKGCGNGGGSLTGGWGCRLKVVTDPMNQMWIQGEPRIFLKNEARTVDRSLDALSCAIRSCCDQANKEFAQMSQAMGGGGGEGMSNEMTTTTPTSLAVMANENELCSRNMVLSAQALVNQNNAHHRVTKPGLIMIITAMDAFLENSDPDVNGGGGDGAEEGGFSETQIRNLLSACEMAIKHPLLLHSPGPVYHMMSNAAVLLCHLLNGLHAKCNPRDSNSIDDINSDEGVGGNSSNNNNMESELFYNTLDTFMAIRKLLDMHRQNLPVRLRCHAIPRPNIGPSKKTDPETPFIDLGETLMCTCRGCQGFVLMGCSPCVAAERSLRSAKVQAVQLEDDDEFKREIDELGDFNLDDDALFSILSRVANN